MATGQSPAAGSDCHQSLNILFFLHLNHVDVDFPHIFRITGTQNTGWIHLFTDLSSKKKSLGQVMKPQDSIRRFIPLVEQLYPFHFCFWINGGSIYTIIMIFRNFNIPQSTPKVSPCLSSCCSPRFQDFHEPGYNRIDRLYLSPTDRICAISSLRVVEIDLHGRKLIHVPVQRDTRVKANIRW